MSRAGACGVVLRLLLALGLTLAAVELARRWPLTVEVGAQGLRTVTAAEAQFLRDLPHPARVTYYVSRPADLPSALRGLERDVSTVLAALAAAAPDRFGYEIVRPEEQAERLRFATARRLAPTAIRSVRRDGWTEREVWSTLEIASGPRDPAVLEGLTPEHLPRLRALLLSQLRELSAPSRPRVAFCAPPGFAALRALLAERAEVVDVELGPGAPPPRDTELLVWIATQPAAPATLAAVEQYRRSGRAVWISASAYRGEVRAQGADFVADLGRRELDLAALWSHFGLGLLEPPLFDLRCEALQLAGGPRAVPFLVRCIAPNQDFRTLPDQPNGSLLFASPTALRIDGETLVERGLDARVLATSSEQSFCWPELATAQELPPLPLGDLEPSRGRTLPKQPLLVLLEPRDRFAGPLLACASASPWSDEFLDAPGFAHRRAAEILLAHLASPDRLVLARAAQAAAPPLRPLEPAAQLLWRAVTAGALPGLLVLLALLRGALGPLSAGLRAGSLRRAGRRLLLALGLLASLGLLGTVTDRAARLGWAADWSARGTNRLSPATLDLARAVAAGEGLEVEWIASRTSDLPPRWRAGARDLQRRLDDLERGVPGSSRRTTVPETLDAAGRAALEDRGLSPFRTDDDTAEGSGRRSVYATLELRSGERRERLLFPDALAFEDTEFRLAFALWRLQSGRSATVALASDLPRLSPAEAHEEYQLRLRFAPSGTDVYSLARAALERAGFGVEHVDTQPPADGSPHLVLPAALDALVWLQPRRDATYVLEALANYLHGGGRVLIAAQHFNLQAQRHRGSEFELVHWPQPQSPDLDTLYLPECGVLLERQLVLDELSFAARIDAQVQRGAQERSYRAQDSVLPFQVRLSAANFAPGPWLDGVSDQAFHGASSIALDRERLAELGLREQVLATSSPRTWTHPWQGGYVPTEVLTGPGAEGYAGPLPLIVRVSGPFPLPAEPLRRSAGTDAPLPPPSAPGELVLVGASEPFKNPWLLHPEFRGDQLLVNLVAHLTLPPEVAELTGRRAVPRGLRYVAPEERARWRGWVLGLGPLAVLALGLVHLVRDRRLRRAAWAAEGQRR